MKGYICTSREMAERLKEAGYPQFILSGFHRHWDEKKGEYTHAPTATELLPKGWVLGNLYDGWNVSGSGPTFINENPHDAAAMAWLWEKGNE